ncbi:peptidoglycan-associated lipoprotein [Natronocella acetinitrilica]|uniref:Peptidoglycan-associated lipoprotein n=1 Tax=Natronocella acetinitrilica TaxID=414046 RepID=A0AAE3G2R9_9GAMM|nr:peptidoglycan-associated lipoprotein Pal [Natronocella acetinitrilica]MCP1674093.1 peptidoglycan-associated lipoprotein [Natronocella acetinitrilica]
MKNTGTTRWIMIGMLALFLTACATLDDETRVEDRPDSDLTEEEMAAIDRERAAAARAAEGRRSLDGEALDELLDDPDSPIGRRTIYFEFDSSDIREQDLEIVEAHARFLADHPDQRIILEGHTDERGSAEYNLALGERRAQSVKRAMVLSGASEDQIRVISYGEEKPADLGSNEEAWSANRRAELVYRDVF